MTVRVLGHNLEDGKSYDSFDEVVDDLEDIIEKKDEEIDELKSQIEDYEQEISDLKSEVEDYRDSEQDA